MGLYSIWQEKTDDSVLGAERVNAYIREYFEKEKDAYAEILAARENKIEGTVGELAEKFGLEPFEVTAFIDGINTSLNSQIEVETLEADSNVVLDIDWKKLYYNMNKAKAPWLYEPFFSLKFLIKFLFFDIFKSLFYCLSCSHSSNSTKFHRFWSYLLQ